MQYYIDMTVSKKEKQSNGKYKIYYRCGCKICEKCWFSLDNEHCICSGPYSGYEEVKDVGKNLGQE
jgi:hypothetical protein